MHPTYIIKTDDKRALDADSRWHRRQEVSRPSQSSLGLSRSGLDLDSGHLKRTHSFDIIRSRWIREGQLRSLGLDTDSKASSDVASFCAMHQHEPATGDSAHVE